MQPVGRGSPCDRDHIDNAATQTASFCGRRTFSLRRHARVTPLPVWRKAVITCHLMDLRIVIEPDQTVLAIRADALRAAGPLSSLRLRARGYLDLYHASNGTCRFALIAAHGALWASWYLVCAKLAAMVFAALDPSLPLSPRRRYRAFATYVDVLKQINHSVMVETFVLVHTVLRLGPDAAARAGIPADLAHDYASAMAGDPSDLRDLYHRHFLWEQQRVVSTTLDDAFARFDWPLMKGLCQRPWVWFSYFKAARSLNFRNFTDQAERVEKGLLAHDRAVEVGYDRLALQTSSRLRAFPGTTVWRAKVIGSARP